MGGKIEKCKHQKEMDRCQKCEEEFTILQPIPCAHLSKAPDNFRKAGEEYNNCCIAKNNNTSEDKGVHKGLPALHDPGFRPVKKLTKDKLLATLGFLKGKGFNEAKEVHKKILVEDLKTLIL